jgi:hypothetical protein
MPELVLAFENRTALLEEYDKNLAHGRAFIMGAFGLPVFSACTLTIEHPETQRRQSFACEVVMVLDQGPQRGTAVQFSDRSEGNLERLKSFVAEQVERTRRAPIETGFEDEATGLRSFNTSAGSDDDQADDQDDDEQDEQDEFDDVDDVDERTNPFGDASAVDDEDGPPTQQRASIASRALKLKNLTPEQRMKFARSSVQEERVLLERMYGSAVWELLLHNPKITVPEVARMARKGTVPRPLLDFIADNEQWVRHSLVRRALLANPRLGADAINKVLRTLPPRELKLVPQQTAYPAGVRQAATRIMRGSQ